MSSKFGLGGAFLGALAANGVSDNDLDRINRRGLSSQVAEALLQIVADDVVDERAENAGRQGVRNNSIEKLASVTGVEYNCLNQPYDEMIATLRRKKITRIGQLASVTRYDLHQFGLKVEQTLYITIALREIDLTLA